MRCEREAEKQAGREEHDGVLHLKANAAEDADPEPPAWVAGFDIAQHAPGAGHPEQGLEGIHREQVLHEHVDRGGQDGESGEGLGHAAATHPARHGASDPDQCSAGKRGQEADRDEGSAEGMADQPCDEGHQRRVVDVAPAEVLAAGEVIHFVAEDAIARSGVEL